MKTKKEYKRDWRPLGRAALNENLEFAKRIAGGDCIFKKQFHSSDSAAKFAADNNHRQLPYKCRHCPAWHLTKIGIQDRSATA